MHLTMVPVGVLHVISILHGLCLTQVLVGVLEATATLQPQPMASSSTVEDQFQQRLQVA